MRVTEVTPFGKSDDEMEAGGARGGVEAEVRRQSRRGTQREKSPRHVYSKLSPLCHLYSGFVKKSPAATHWLTWFVCDGTGDWISLLYIWSVARFITLRTFVLRKYYICWSAGRCLFTSFSYGALSCQIPSVCLSNNFLSASQQPAASAKTRR